MKKAPITIRGKVARIMGDQRPRTEKVSALRALWENEDARWREMIKFLVAFELRKWIEKNDRFEGRDR